MSATADRDAVIDDLLIVTCEALQEARNRLSPQTSQANDRAEAAQFIIDKAPGTAHAPQVGTPSADRLADKHNKRLNSCTAMPGPASCPDAPAGSSGVGVKTNRGKSLCVPPSTRSIWIHVAAQTPSVPGCVHAGMRRRTTPRPDPATGPWRWLAPIVVSRMAA
ncbi:MAG TPA: hypothetical protein VFU81_10715 [Thermomicrobiales bacterium]|nr:hypothetical protein [Thermomicrobiales bacterium]